MLKHAKNFMHLQCIRFYLLINQPVMHIFLLLHLLGRFIHHQNCFIIKGLYYISSMFLGAIHNFIKSINLPSEYYCISLKLLHYLISIF